jgi:hypothetical protein
LGWRRFLLSLDLFVRRLVRIALHPHHAHEVVGPLARAAAGVLPTLVAIRLVLVILALGSERLALLRQLFEGEGSAHGIFLASRRISYSVSPMVQFHILSHRLFSFVICLTNRGRYSKKAMSQVFFPVMTSLLTVT